MATIEESAVFEYCQRVFRELDERDGGYYPSRHDKPAFTQTAEHFSISEAEVDRIFNEYSKQAADIEMEKIKKMPPALRKKVIEQRARDIFRNNRDLPFYKLEGPPSQELTDALDILSEEYRALVEAIAQSGWTIPLSIDIRGFEELKKLVGSDAAIESYFVDYYNGPELKLMCRKIKRVLKSTAQQAIFTECIAAFEKKMFSVCLTTLLTVLEGFISVFDDNPQDIRVMRVCRFHADEEMRKRNNIKSLCWLSMYEYTKILYQKSDFSQPEPSTINRHWIQHGRTGKSAESTDCLRLFNALSTLTSIKQSQTCEIE
jgi:hypothetical protein